MNLCSTLSKARLKLLYLQISAISLRIFQRFRLVKFIEKFKTGVKNLNIDKVIACDKYLHELFFPFYFHLSKNLFLTLKNNEVADLTHFSTAVFKVFKNNETVDCSRTFLNCFETLASTGNRFLILILSQSDAINYNSTVLAPFF